MTTFTAATPDFEELVKAAVLSMPAAKHLGFDFGRVAPGEAEIVQPYREELTEHNGFFQAGVVGALADFAGGSAGITLLGPGWVSMTVDYTVKLVAPAEGEKIVARGRVIKPSQVMTVAAADVYAVNGSDEKLCATAFVTMHNIKLSKGTSCKAVAVEAHGYREPEAAAAGSATGGVPTSAGPTV